jgi:hypothetical protein
MPAARVHPALRRPVLKSLRRAWRDPATLQIGADPDRARVVAGLPPDAAALLRLLDGSTDRDGFVAAARRRGWSGGDAERLLDVLDEAGALDDAAVGAATLRAIALADRDRLAPELAAATFVRPGLGAGAAVATARSAARVEVRGAGRVGAALAGLLAAAGVGAVRVCDGRETRGVDVGAGGLALEHVGRPRAEAAIAAYRRHAPRTRRDLAGDPDLVVLTDRGTSDAADELVRAGVPHLPLVVLDATAWIGPLVLPGRTACLRCVDAHRRDRDPAWSSVAAQLSAPPPAGDPGVDGALAAAAAAQGALAALDHVDSSALGGRAELAGRGLVLRLPGGLPRQVTWKTHGACGCQWDRGALTMAG